jgi:hypothetical protein
VIEPAEWTEEAALDRWLSDLEGASILTELVRVRLEEDSVHQGDFREEAYRAAAQNWLKRGQPGVALSLLERGVGGPSGPEDGQEAIRRAGGGLADELDLFGVGRPGSAGLPALTADELSALRQELDPEQALLQIKAAGRRLQAHGAEARELLRRFLERQKGT